MTSKRILIVDDSSMMRKMIAKILQPPKHLVVGEARNGIEAVQMYKALKPDIVTMDITMREMNGLEAAEEILKHDNQAQIIFLSNLDEKKYRHEVEELGGIGFVNKHQSKEILSIIDKH